MKNLISRLSRFCKTLSQFTPLKLPTIQRQVNKKKFQEKFFSYLIFMLNLCTFIQVIICMNDSKDITASKDIVINGQNKNS